MVLKIGKIYRSACTFILLEEFMIRNEFENKKEKSHFKEFIPNRSLTCKQ